MLGRVSEKRQTLGQSEKHEGGQKADLLISESQNDEHSSDDLSETVISSLR